MSQLDEYDNTELVRALRGGETRAFTELIRRHQGRIYNLAYNYVKDEEEAKDLTQDIFITAHRNLGSLREEHKFAAWLYQLALNHCRNRYKRLQRRGFFRSSSLDDPDSPLQLTSGETPEGELDRQDRDNLVRRGIAQLAAAEKEIILLRDIEGLSYDEISNILEIPLGTVKSKLNRARLALKGRLEKLLPGTGEF
ncbi:MAG: sigma-70 family RNA polymerase sigma factor [Desulfurivibrio sp.]|nr:sigma-70 family RNA polymerase sigma factor [Desulfurivibrio sp.]